jgi:ABC-type multidrug transport system ATPase subunit
MTAPVVHLQGIGHRLAARFALDIPTLTIGPGITAVLGANGSGKTTLLRILATVIEPAGDLVAVRRPRHHVPPPGYLPQTTACRAGCPRSTMSTSSP